LSHAQFVRRLHRDDALAGARVHFANTFQANPIALTAHHLADQLEDIIWAGLDFARTSGSLAVASLGPIYSPGSTREFADLDALHQTLCAMQSADVICFETCSTLNALSAVAFAVHRVEPIADIPIWLSVSYQRRADGKPVSLDQHGPELFARHAIRHGVTALGVNCGQDIGSEQLCEIVHRYRQETDLPIFVRPNAGSPPNQGSLTCERFADLGEELAKLGVSMIGGCCGTGSEHIRALGLRFE
jgi:5-methyltetrahydrofolate--homocysteine methyltransferase